MINVLENVSNSGHSFTTGTLVDITYYTNQGPRVSIRLTKTEWSRSYPGFVTFSGYLHDDNTLLCEGLLDTGHHKICYAKPCEATLEALVEATNRKVAATAT